MSLLLFNLHIVDLHPESRKGNIGSVELGGDRIRNLTYADDVVLILKNRITPSYKI